MSDQYQTVTKLLLQRMAFVLGLITVIHVQAAKHPEPQELFQFLGIKQQELASLDQGKTVSFNVAEDNDKELAVGVVIYLTATPVKIIEFINNKGLAYLDTDTDVTAQGAIPAQATLDTFKGFGFSAEDDEANDFSKASPGSQFNLSAHEFQELKNTDFAEPDAASQSYRKILLDRLQAYRKNGLKAIATYDRGNGTEATPAGELLAASLDSKIVARYFPVLYKAWLNYPAVLPAGADEGFFWLNRMVEGRPTAILGHRVIMTVGTAEVILSRQFYVGHSYNSNQISITCLPYRNGSLVFYANRNFTDQITGFGSSLKHYIGCEQMEGEIIKWLTKLRMALKQTGAL